MPLAKSSCGLPCEWTTRLDLTEVSWAGLSLASRPITRKRAAMEAGLATAAAALDAHWNGTTTAMASAVDGSAARGNSSGRRLRPRPPQGRREHGELNLGSPGPGDAPERAGDERGVRRWNGARRQVVTLRPRRAPTWWRRSRGGGAGSA
jgi:hypothetical protein